MHLIEGLPRRQFATYMKAHHCAIDGVGSMHLTNSMMSTRRRAKVSYSPFSQQAHEIYKEKLDQAKKRRLQPKEDEIRAVSELLREQLGGTVNVANALRQTAEVWLGRKGNLAVPWHDVPKTSYNTRITGARRFVAQSWPFARIHAMGKAYDGTLNDAVLAMCAGALRRHLLELGELPKHSLKAMAPISLRDADDVDAANALAFLTANLNTDIVDPAARMQAIQASMQAAKAQFKGMNRREIEVYTLLTQAPTLLSSMAGLASRFPAFSTVISNVPGPREPLYWNGARLDGMYPVSIPFDGFAVNITLVSNCRNLDVGIIACRHSVPQVQRLIDYMEDSLLELEQAAGLSPWVTRGRHDKTMAGDKTAADARAKVPAKRKAAAKSRAKAKVKPGS
jgi:diacylglycerol O-acyltransferase